MEKEIIEAAKKLVEAINNNITNLYQDDLSETHDCIILNGAENVKGIGDEVEEEVFPGISKQLEELERLLENKEEKQYIDEGIENGPKFYSKEEAIKVIKNVLQQDTELLMAYGGEVSKISEDDLLEIGYKHYHISEH